MPLSPRLLIPLCALAAGLALGFIQCPGLLAVLLFATLVFSCRYLPDTLWTPAVLIVGLLLAAHLLPGFQAWTILPPQQISADAAPYSLRLSWDKLLLGLILLAWWLGRPMTRKEADKRFVIAFAGTLALVPALALALGLVSWQPKWPDMLWPWLAINLGVAVLAEELLFRGLLQPWLIRLLGTWPGLLLTALLFGAAHIPFSPLFAVVATVAGLGYGLAFHYSGRLSLAIALHGLVNLTHLLLLSYPLRLG